MLPVRSLRPSVLRPTPGCRALATASSTSSISARQPPPPPRLSGITTPDHVSKKIKTYPPPPSVAVRAKDPVRLINAFYISQLDPTGARERLFSRTNPEGAKVGDILLVRTKNGDPFAGVLLNIRQRGVDTAILLRNELLRTSVEMWFKVYSPLVETVEIVQRKLKRARRARLTYMRKPRHDIGSVQNIVRQYLKQQATLTMASETKGRDTNSDKRGSKSGK